MINAENIIEKYYPKESPLYHILITHSRQVRDKALEIVDQHPELEIDRQFVSEATMLHDIGIYLCNAPKIHCVGSAKYIEHGYLGADLLRKEALPRHALVAERHTGTGIKLEEIRQNNLPLPHRNMEPVSIEEQVICYADKFYSKSNLNAEHSLEHIRKSLSKFGEETVLKFDEWHRLFG